MSGQLHVPVALPQGKELRVPTGGWLHPEASVEVLKQRQPVLRRKLGRNDTVTIGFRETELNSTDSRQGKAEGPDKPDSTKGREFLDLLSEC